MNEDQFLTNNLDEQNNLGVGNESQIDVQEPDDMFGDIDSLKSDEEVNTPQKSIDQMQDAVVVPLSKGASSWMMKIFILLVALAVLFGLFILLYPYVSSFFVGEEDSENMVIYVEEEATEFVEDVYDYDSNYEETFFLEESLPSELLIEETVDFSEPIDVESELVNEESPAILEDSDLNGGGDIFVDLNKDTDNDGLTDEEERLLGTHIMKADTDNDGLTDREEVMVYKTDPLNADTDGDGLTDYDEVMVYKTDPLNADTDGDGFPDGLEVSRGYDPNVPAN